MEYRRSRGRAAAEGCKRSDRTGRSSAPAAVEAARCLLAVVGVGVGWVHERAACANAAQATRTGIEKLRRMRSPIRLCGMRGAESTSLLAVVKWGLAQLVGPVYRAGRGVSGVQVIDSLLHVAPQYIQVRMPHETLQANKVHAGPQAIESECAPEGMERRR